MTWNAIPAQAGIHDSEPRFDGCMDSAGRERPYANVDHSIREIGIAAEMMRFSRRTSGNRMFNRRKSHH